MTKPDPERIDHENPECTDDVFARARPAAEVMGAAFMGKVRKRGRPKSLAPRPAISLRLDAKVVEHLRASGPGWQTRVNDALAKLIARGAL
jgi:uncharacterized protein (DUF4415 family)